MDRTRKNLIEELIRVGRLIDPAPGTETRKGKNAAKLPSIRQQSEVSARSPMEDIEGLPIVNDVVDRPYTTKDMFVDPAGGHISRLANSLEGQQPAASTSGSSDTPVSKRIEPAATDPEKQLSEEAPTIRFPAEELARELVTLIEDRVSQRSGEQLDDSFRDELTQAVIAQLQGWLKYD